MKKGEIINYHQIPTEVDTATDDSQRHQRTLKDRPGTSFDEAVLYQFRSMIHNNILMLNTNRMKLISNDFSNYSLYKNKKDKILNKFMELHSKCI